MKKYRELSDVNSYFNKADDTEMIFVLLARDICAPTIIRKWCELRVTQGKNIWEDDQIEEALITANIMESQQKEKKK